MTPTRFLAAATVAAVVLVSAPLPPAAPAQPDPVTPDDPGTTEPVTPAEPPPVEPPPAPEPPPQPVAEQDVGGGGGATVEEPTGEQPTDPVAVPRADGSDRGDARSGVVPAPPISVPTGRDTTRITTADTALRSSVHGYVRRGYVHRPQTLARP